VIEHEGNNNRLMEVRNWNPTCTVTMCRTIAKLNAFSRDLADRVVMNRLKQVLSLVLSCCIVLATCPELVLADDDSTADTPVVSAKPTPQELQQLVAPIALYPDSLVAQILAASTYPDQVVEADRWLQAHPEVKGDELAQAVDQQPWDPSVKALTEFPSVLANMDKNLSWTSSLGDAYINDQQGVMDAVQGMRQSAERAGNLKSTDQLKVSDQGQTIVIEPANPEVVYVPQYDPWIVYSAPVVAWPGWYWYPGLYWTSPGIGFGIGFGVGFFSGFGWGWHHWAPDWRRHTIIVNHNVFVSHSRSVINRNYYANRRADIMHNRGGIDRGGFAPQGGGRPGGFAQRGFAQHGFAGSHLDGGGHSGAFGGFNHGGDVRGFSNRGFSSMGGFHGGGGGFHGGGHGGGHR
jgi:Protein of unknown function (DUF3300)